MEIGTIALYGFLVLVMIVGVAGAVIPALPGSSLILVAIIIWGAVKGFSGVTVALGVAIAVFVLSLAVDFLSSYVGAKKAGASDWGQWGAIIGLLLGFFGLLPALPIGGPLVGMLFGPIVGAFTGEFLYHRRLELKERAQISFKATLGIIVGTIVGNIIQGVLALATVIVFLVTTWSQAMA